MPGWFAGCDCCDGCAYRKSAGDGFLADYDPNLYDLNNYNKMALQDMLNDPNQPTFNRATQGQYPLGSVFKIFTMSAALESGVFTPASTYDCEYAFTEIPMSPSTIGTGRTARMKKRPPAKILAPNRSATPAAC